MSYNYSVGDKVVCVDDKFPPVTKDLYKELPKQGRTYVVRDMRLGVSLGPGRKGEVATLLVGMKNPHGPPPASEERGFAAWRFVPLAEFRKVEAKVDEAIKWGHGVKEGVAA